MSDGRDDTQARPAGGVKPSPDLLQKWLHAPYWGPEEGVALAFGLDPSRVVEARQNDHPCLKAADPAPHFARLARRAVSQGDLEEEARPSVFLDWAEGVGLVFHGIWTLILNPRIWMSKPNPRIPAGPDGTLETVGETMKPVSEFIERRDELIRNWALAPTWDLEEGACLANNLSPRLMLGRDSFPRPHPAADSVNRLLEFALRARRQRQISSHPTPAEFIAWSEGVGVPFDAKWLEAIGEPRVDDDWTSQSQRPIKRTGRRGRKASYDWTGARAEFDRLMEHHGDLTIDDSEWSSQADVERAIADWFSQSFDSEPVESMIRTHVAEWLKQHEADKADN